MNTRIFFALTTLIILMNDVILMAQPGGPAPNIPGVPVQAPIDGGLGLLAAAGGAYAWKKLRDKRNEPTDEDIIA